MAEPWLKILNRLDKPAGPIKIYTVTDSNELRSMPETYKDYLRFLNSLLIYLRNNNVFLPGYRHEKKYLFSYYYVASFCCIDGPG